MLEFLLIAGCIVVGFMLLGMMLEGAVTGILATLWAGVNVVRLYRGAWRMGQTRVQKAEYLFMLTLILVAAVGAVAAFLQWLFA